MPDESRHYTLSLPDIQRHLHISLFFLMLYALTGVSL